MICPVLLGVDLKLHPAEEGAIQSNAISQGNPSRKKEHPAGYVMWVDVLRHEADQTPSKDTDIEYREVENAETGEVTKEEVCRTCTTTSRGTRTIKAKVLVAEAAMAREVCSMTINASVSNSHTDKSSVIHPRPVLIDPPSSWVVMKDLLKRTAKVLAK
tara:strand:+ start:1258 stop:1734 length:477 start_codon:yes stop_codon:yes gene_type:complete